MLDPLDNGLFDIPDYDQIEDEAFPPLPPPMSPGQEENQEGPFANGEEEGEESKLPEVPKRRTVKRPQPKLDSQRLTSERGLPALRGLFDNVRFKGKGHEADDLRVLMQRMENWAHRLYPKLQFEDFIDKVESLGAKKDVQTCLKRIRLDMPLTHDDFIGKEDEQPQEDRVPDDPFDEIAFPDGPIHSTPAPVIHSTPAPVIHSTPAPAPVSLSEEQRQRIELNKKLAMERRQARMQQQQQQGDSQLNTSAAEGEGPSTSSSASSSQANQEPQQNSSASSLANQEPQQKEPEQDVDAEQEQDNTSSTQNVAASTETSPPLPPPPRADSPLFDTEGDSPAPKLTNGIEDDSD